MALLVCVAGSFAPGPAHAESCQETEEEKDDFYRSLLPADDRIEAGDDPSTLALVPCSADVTLVLLDEDTLAPAADHVRSEHSLRELFSRGPPIGRR